MGSNPRQRLKSAIPQTRTAVAVVAVQPGRGKIGSYLRYLPTSTRSQRRMSLFPLLLFSPAGARYDPILGNSPGKRLTKKEGAVAAVAVQPRRGGIRSSPGQRPGSTSPQRKKLLFPLLFCSPERARQPSGGATMSQSLSKILVHVIFSTKNRTPCLPSPVRPLLWRYLAGALDALDSRAIQIGGTSDHVHILCHMSKTVAICKLVEQIKIESSKWLKAQDGDLKAFGWQAGYGAFSIGQSAVAATESYILRRRNTIGEYRLRRSTAASWRSTRFRLTNGTSGLDDCLALTGLNNDNRENNTYCVWPRDPGRCPGLDRISPLRGCTATTATALPSL